jgi:hypothetical protein
VKCIQIKLRFFLGGNFSGFKHGKYVPNKGKMRRKGRKKKSGVILK